MEPSPAGSRRGGPARPGLRGEGGNRISDEISVHIQRYGLLADLSVLENVRIAHRARTRYGLAGALLWLPSLRREEERIIQESLALLRRFGLDGAAGEEARHLPYGQQRRLDVARALAPKPRLLLQDEPDSKAIPGRGSGLRAAGGGLTTLSAPGRGIRTCDGPRVTRQRPYIRPRRPTMVLSAGSESGERRRGGALKPLIRWRPCRGPVERECPSP